MVEYVPQWSLVMAKNNEIYVERREQGDYAVRRPGSERASDVLPTQRRAIERAGEIAPTLQSMSSGSAIRKPEAATNIGILDCRGRRKPVMSTQSV